MSKQVKVGQITQMLPRMSHYQSDLLRMKEEALVVLRSEVYNIYMQIQRQTDEEPHSNSEGEKGEEVEKVESSIKRITPWKLIPQEQENEDKEGATEDEQTQPRESSIGKGEGSSSSIENNEQAIPTTQSP